MDNTRFSVERDVTHTRPIRARASLHRSSIPTKFVSLLLVALMATLGCPVAPDGKPTAGSRDHQRPADVAFRYGSVNAMGGNLRVPRVDLSTDTPIGTLKAGSVFNSATKAWTWSFDETYKNGTFTDATDAAHTDLDDLAEGAAIAGTTWVKGAELRDSLLRMLVSRPPMLHLRAGPILLSL